MATLELETRFMEAAIEAAKVSAANGDYGIGAVIARGDEIISIGYETLKSANDPVNGHAEVDAIRKACSMLQQHYLEECVLYSTHEPCPMCMTATIWAKIPKVAYAVSRDDMIEEMKRRSNGKFSWRQIAIPAEYIVEHGEPKVELVPGYMRDEGMKLFDLTGK